MNVYDFDKTIYKRDSTVHFWLHCLARHPRILKAIPRQLYAGLRYMAGRMPKTRFKEVFFTFLPLLKDVEASVDAFWDKHAGGIADWYLAQKQETDVVISASPVFLLAPIARRLGIAVPIATRVDVATGRIDGENCYGEEKVHRFLAEYPDEPIAAFYSDSLSDQPMASLAREAFLVGKTIERWPFPASERIY